MKNILIVGAVVIVVLAGVLVFTNNKDLALDATKGSENAKVSSGEAVDSDLRTAERQGEVETGSQMDPSSMENGSDDSTARTNISSEVSISEADKSVSFDVSGVNFAFDVTEMRVKEGDIVTVNFVSADGYHDWVVDEFDAATERVQTDGVTSVTFVANKKGTFEYYCSVGSHRAQGMIGAFIVE